MSDSRGRRTTCRRSTMRSKAAIAVAGGLTAHRAVTQLRVARQERLGTWRKIGRRAQSGSIGERSFMRIAGDTGTRKLPAQACVGAPQAIGRPRPSGTSDMPGNPHEPADKAATERRDQRRPVRRMHAETREDSKLSIDIELHDAFVPRGVESVPFLHEMREQRRRIQQAGAARDPSGRMSRMPRRRRSGATIAVGSIRRQPRPSIHTSAQA